MWHIHKVSFPFIETKPSLMQKFIGTDSARVELFFSIFTSGIETFVIQWDLLLYTCVVQVCRPKLELLCDTYPPVILKTMKLTVQKFLEVVMWGCSEFLLPMSKYDSLEINTAGICVTLEIIRTFKGSWNWYLRRFQQNHNVYHQRRYS